jgi:hypothetical protein
MTLSLLVGRLSRVGPSAANGLTSDPRFVLLLSRTEETLPYSNPQVLYIYYIHSYVYIVLLYIYKHMV